MGFTDFWNNLWRNPPQVYSPSITLAQPNLGGLRTPANSQNAAGSNASNYVSNPDYPGSSGSQGSLNLLTPGADFYPKVDPTAEKVGDPYAFYDELARLLSATGVDPNTAAAQAAGAFNPAIAALQSEKKGAKKRSKQDRAASKADYGAIAGEYSKDSEAARKRAVAEEAKYNKEMMQGVSEVSETYTKMAAENQAELSQLGLGASTQALAQQKLDAASQQEQAVARQMNQAQRDFAVNEANAMADYMQTNVGTTKQAGAEQDFALVRNLENILGALNKEEAGLRTQAGTAANQARQFAQNYALQRIGTGLQLDAARGARWEMLNPQGVGGDAASQEWISKARGIADAGKYLQSVVGLPPEKANAVATRIYSTPELRDEIYNIGNNAGDQQKITPAVAQQKLSAIADELGLPAEVVFTYWEIMGR